MSENPNEVHVIGGSVLPVVVSLTTGTWVSMIACPHVGHLALCCLPSIDVSITG